MRTLFPMTCYLRHPDAVFERAGRQVDIDDRERVETVSH